MLTALQMGRHWLFMTFFGFFLAGVFGLCAWWVYGRMFLLGQGHGKRWTSPLSPLTTPRWRKESGILFDLEERHQV